MADTRIQWATKVWNPIVGCKKVSAGCDNCYAERFARRLKGSGHKAYQDVVKLGPGGGWTGKIGVDQKSILLPGSWRKPQRVFAGSMTDLFRPEVDSTDFNLIFTVMAYTSRHRYIVLTKRPQYAVGIDFPPNVAVGISAETQDDYKYRSHQIGLTRAAIKVVSFEPLLGPIDLSAVDFRPDWVIGGGETGAGARRCEPGWIWHLIEQCSDLKIPFFFKSWGGWCKRYDTGLVIEADDFREIPAALRVGKECENEVE